MSVFINYTNHASACWSRPQAEAAEVYGTIVDRPFPDIPADWTAAQVQDLARQETAAIIAMHPAAVLCQGEFTYTCACVAALTDAGIPVLAACSERDSVVTVDAAGISHKTAQFTFVQFREY